MQETSMRRNLGIERSSSMLDPSLDWSQASLNGFKWFIQEREKIKLRKEAGLPRPWTDDEVLDKTKFTNIYRQDDKTSKFIFASLMEYTGINLFGNLVIARLINRIDVLQKVLPCSKETDLLFLLEEPCMNSAAYQIAPNLAATHGRETNREVIVHDIRNYIRPAFEAMNTTDNLSIAAERVNNALKGCLKFVSMQIVMDYDYLTGSHPDQSNLTVGQGATPIIRELGSLDFICKELNMQPIDVEHAACEYRKYIQRQGKNLKNYSYKPNSMGIKCHDKENIGQ